MADMLGTRPPDAASTKAITVPTVAGDQVDLTVDLAWPERADSPLLALILPGIGTSLATYRPLVTALAVRGHAVAMPRLPFVDIETRLDVVALLDALETRLSDQVRGRLGVVGHSLGNFHLVEALCAERSTELPAIALVAASTVATPAEDAGSLAHTTALLVVHSRRDLLCSYSAARRLYDSATGHRCIVTLEGSDHGAGVLTASPALARRLVPAITVDFFEGVRSGATDDLRRRALLVEATRLGAVEAELVCT